MDSVQDSSDIPWNSYALGTSDLSILAGRGRPIVIGMIGPTGSGKTTLLAHLYMTLLKSGGLPGWLFAGSWTLGGWETLVQYSRWTGEPPPSFPPHTSSSGRIPGLLHISFRSQTGMLRDFMFTDAPGEWFTEWAKAPDSPSAVGARWVLKHSNYILLLADCDALANEATLPKARRETRDITERIGALITKVPIAFTWTKTDITLPQETRETLEYSRQQFVPTSRILETTIDKPESIAKLFSIAIESSTEQLNQINLQEPRSIQDPFLAFRGSYDNI